MKAQKFKGQTLTRTKVINRILKVHSANNSALSESLWYQDAYSFASALSDTHTTAQAAGIIAALSPLKSWNSNKTLAALFTQGQRVGLHTGVMISKAEQIEETTRPDKILSILNGKKISAFFTNILNPTESGRVTIDRHAIAVCLGRTIRDNEASLTPKQYQFMEQCYKLAGARVGLLGHEIQATTWCEWRRMKAA